MKHKKYLILLIIPVLILLINRTFSLSYTQEIKSIEIQSNDYDNPGSWHIDKSAEWTGFGKARVTFDVNSIIKTGNGHYKDVILVMDKSGSMEGEKLNKAKEDSIDLTNYLLSDSRNRLALITFDTSSSIISGFTNNRTQMVNYINNLHEGGSTNYNAGLLKVEEVMANYVKDDNKDLVVLFLTDGYPNEETRNEKATYQMLKDKYPYMIINGIQYEMGKNIIQDIIDVSDNQYIANMDTLNNVLFEASIVPQAYENFVIEDYIYGDYFYVDSVNDIEVSFGTVTVENGNNTQKVTWNLGNNFVTGRNIQMNINLKLKNTYHNTRGLYPTNLRETIVSKLPNENTKTKTSEDTPVLLNAYNVIYETNVPDGCTLPSIQSEEHYVYQTVTKRNDTLTCPGYVFKGWYIKGSDIADIYMINEDTFIMPSHDVTIRGTWTKHDIVETMDGTVRIKGEGTLMENGIASNYTFGKEIDRTSFESITTLNEIVIPTTVIDYWDVSAEQNGSVIAWYTDNDNDGKYELFLAQEDGVKANPDSSYAFYYFRNVENIDLSYFDISNVTNMSFMFYSVGYNAPTVTIGNLSNWDVSKVTNMYCMFSQLAYNSTSFNIGDLSNWNTKNVTDMSGMFSSIGYSSQSFNIGNLSNWNLSKVTSISSMFSNAGYNATTWSVGDLSGWDTSKVTDMYSIFYGAGYNATTFNLDLSNWNISQVINMNSAFNKAGYKATTWSIGDLSNWNVSKLAYSSKMFENAGYSTTNWSVGDLSNWNISQFTDMSNMFYYAGYKSTTFNLGDLSNWDTSKVTNMAYLFGNSGYSSTSWNVGDLSNWDTSNVTSMKALFNNVGRLNQTFILNLSNWDTGKVTDMSNMFYNTGYMATTWSIGDLSNWNVSKVTTMQQLFNGAGYNATTWSIGDLSNWNISNLKSMYSMFSSAGYKSTTFNLGNLGNWNTSNVITMYYAFHCLGNNATTWNIGDLSNWDTSKVTNMSGMFDSAGKNATTWSVGDLSNWNTSNVTSMGSMFSYTGYNASTWNIGNVGQWDTSKVTSMPSMFGHAGYNATTFNLDLSNWDVSNVTRMDSMFENSGYNATSWSIGDLSNWDTGSVTDMKYMFNGAGYNATTWNSFGTLKIYATDISLLFYNCRKANATLNIYSNPTTYRSAFSIAATEPGSGITVNYSRITTNIDNIIATGSNVVKGVQLD